MILLWHTSPKYLLLHQFFLGELLEVPNLVIAPKLNLRILVWRIGVGVGREHSPVLVPVVVVLIVQITPLILVHHKRPF